MELLLCGAGNFFSSFPFRLNNHKKSMIKLQRQKSILIIGEMHFAGPSKGHLIIGSLLDISYRCGRPIYLLLPVDVLANVLADIVS
jgi:hypothetical protein